MFGFPAEIKFLEKNEDHPEIHSLAMISQLIQLIIYQVDQLNMKSSNKPINHLISQSIS